LAVIYSEMAHLPAIQDVTTIWQKLAGQSGLRLSMSWSLFAQGWLYYQRNELAAAEETFRRLTDMAWAAHGHAVLDGYTGLVLATLARGCPDEGLLQIRALNDRVLERGMLALAGVAQSLEQRVALAVEPGSSLDWRPQARSALVPVDFWEQPVLTHARTLLAVGSPDGLAQAAELLADSRARALARSSNRSLIEVGALQALVLAAQGHAAGTLAALQEAVERAVPCGALRLLADCGPGLIGLLRLQQAAGIAPRYIENVLAAFGEPVAVPVVPARLQPHSVCASATISKAARAYAVRLVTGRPPQVLVEHIDADRKHPCRENQGNPQTEIDDNY
jgi:hypothetical protein